MDFGLVDEPQNLLRIWSKFENVIMKARLKGFDSYWMNFITYGLLFGVKTQIFFKNSFHLEKTMDWVEIFHACCNQWTSYKDNFFNGITFFRNDTLLILNYKNLLGLQKIQRKWTFGLGNCWRFLVHPTMHLPIFCWSWSH